MQLSWNQSITETDTTVLLIFEAPDGKIRFDCHVANPRTCHWSVSPADSSSEARSIETGSSLGE